MIKIYNTLSAALDAFVPRKREKSIYVCVWTDRIYIFISERKCKTGYCV